MVSHPLTTDRYIPTLESNDDTKKWIEGRGFLLRGGPPHEPNPVIVIELPQNRIITIDLFEDEAPNTVANFIELCEKKYFDGLKFTKEGDKRLVIGAKTEDPATHLLEFEKTEREAGIGVLVMKKKKGAADNLGAEFFILLYEDPDLKDHTIFGKIRDIGGGLEPIRIYRPEDTIVTIKVDSKREHEYKATKKNP